MGDAFFAAFLGLIAMTCLGAVGLGQLLSGHPRLGWGLVALACLVSATGWICVCWQDWQYIAMS
jgi:hypothetical protein